MIFVQNILATAINKKKFQFLRVKDEMELSVQCAAFILAMIIFAVGSSKYRLYKVHRAKV